jgi:CheY-like chemotaxis protein
MHPTEPSWPTRVLIVDDCADAADSLALLLKEVWGYEVLVAYNSSSALELAAAYRPAVVFLDIGLPGPDGYEVARRLRALGELSGLLLVAVTGYGCAADRHRCLEAGFDAHLVKPVDPDEVGALLRSVRGILDAYTGSKQAPLPVA